MLQWRQPAIAQLGSPNPPSSQHNCETGGAAVPYLQMNTVASYCLGAVCAAHHQPLPLLVAQSRHSSNCPHLAWGCTCMLAGVMGRAASSVAWQLCQGLAGGPSRRTGPAQASARQAWTTSGEAPTTAMNRQ